MMHILQQETKTIQGQMKRCTYYAIQHHDAQLSWPTSHLQQKFKSQQQGEHFPVLQKILQEIFRTFCCLVPHVTHANSKKWHTVQCTNNARC